MRNDRKKNSKKNSRFIIFGFKCVAKKYRKDDLKIFSSYLVYRHNIIWLNLPKDDCHFGYTEEPGGGGGGVGWQVYRTSPDRLAGVLHSCEKSPDRLAGVLHSY